MPSVMPYSGWPLRRRNVAIQAQERFGAQSAPPGMVRGESSGATRARLFEVHFRKYVLTSDAELTSVSAIRGKRRRLAGISSAPRRTTNKVPARRKDRRKGETRIRKLESAPKIPEDPRDFISWLRIIGKSLLPAMTGSA